MKRQTVPAHSLQQCCIKKYSRILVVSVGIIQHLERKEKSLMFSTKWLFFFFWFWPVIEQKHSLCDIYPNMVVAVFVAWQHVEKSFRLQTIEVISEAFLLFELKQNTIHNTMNCKYIVDSIETVNMYTKHGNAPTPTSFQKIWQIIKFVLEQETHFQTCSGPPHPLSSLSELCRHLMQKLVLRILFFWYKLSKTHHSKSN